MRRHESGYPDNLSLREIKAVLPGEADSLLIDRCQSKRPDRVRAGGSSFASHLGGCIRRDHGAYRLARLPQ